MLQEPRQMGSCGAVAAPINFNDIMFEKTIWYNLLAVNTICYDLFWRHSIFKVSDTFVSVSKTVFSEISVESLVNKSVNEINVYLCYVSLCSSV